MMQQVSSLRVSIPVRFLLNGTRELSGRLIRLSEHGALAEGVIGAVDGAPIAVFLGTGERIEGTARQLAPTVATITVSESRHSRARLAALMQRQRAKSSDLLPPADWQDRATRYAVPQGQTYAETADGRPFSCRILDMSLTGLGIATDEDLPIGDIVRVGRSMAQVVRRTAVGYGLMIVGMPALPNIWRVPKPRQVALEDATSYDF